MLEAEAEDEDKNLASRPDSPRGLNITESNRKTKPLPNYQQIVLNRIEACK